MLAGRFAALNEMKSFLELILNWFYIYASYSLLTPGSIEVTTVVVYIVVHFDEQTRPCAKRLHRSTRVYLPSIPPLNPHIPQISPSQLYVRSNLYATSVSNKVSNSSVNQRTCRSSDLHHTPAILPSPLPHLVT